MISYKYNIHRFHLRPQRNENHKTQGNDKKIKENGKLEDVVDLIEKIRLIHIDGFGHMLVYFFYLIIGQTP